MNKNKKRLGLVLPDNISFDQHKSDNDTTDELEHKKSETIGLPNVEEDLLESELDNSAENNKVIDDSGKKTSLK